MYTFSLIWGMKYLLLIISLSFLSVGCESRYTFEKSSYVIYRYDNWTGKVHRKHINEHHNTGKKTPKGWIEINK